MLFGVPVNFELIEFGSAYSISTLVKVTVTFHRKDLFQLEGVNWSWGVGCPLTSQILNQMKQESRL